MQKSGAYLVRHALEQLPVAFTFGIPGVHNTELYDELGKSDKIHPVLVTHEQGAAFMADAISRTSPKGEIGVLVVVPAAGLTHAMSGIGEAYLDGVPMLVITGGTRTDVPYKYQLHELDQQKLLAGVTKATYKVERHEDIVPTIFEAYRKAVSGCPGPVFVEIPVNLQLFGGEVEVLGSFSPAPAAPAAAQTDVERALEMLNRAERPGIFVGWGAVDVAAEIAQIAERLGAPVSTTLQGLSAFSARHPLHAGMGFSRAAVPAAENAFARCDCLLAVGTRFGEIPTGSFGCVVPEALIHVDIDREVLGKNFPAKLAVCADSKDFVPRLAQALAKAGIDHSARREAVQKQIQADKRTYVAEWEAHQSAPRVNPGRFFQVLRQKLPDDAMFVVDDGNHTFLAAELLPVLQPRSFVSPTDFNCMGYAVPGAIGAKLANPNRTVVGIVGDGAFLMTGLEIITAATERAPVAYFVFYDGELSQISQGQEIPYNRKTCTVLGEVKLEGIATATGARYVRIDDDQGIGRGIDEALATVGKGQAVIVDVRIDYSKRTRFTDGVVKTVLKRFPLGDKFRFIGRALVRKVTG